MSVRGWLMAALYDRLAAASEREGMAARRQKLVAAATGRVLEVGAGTGLNLEHYSDELDELVLTEPEPAMARKLSRRLEELGRPARVINAAAERLPFDDDSFDTAVCTLVLCSVDDPGRALDEVRRRQDRINPIWRFVGNGCNCNRPTLSLIDATFSVTEVERGDVPKAPSIVRPLVSGRAVANP